jgi:hypothetical protein
MNRKGERHENENKKKEGYMQPIREARANYYDHNFIYLRELLPQPKSIQRVSAVRSLGINNVVRST